MDRAHLVEDQLYNPGWFENQRDVYGKTVDYLNIYGTKTQQRLPARNLALPVIAHYRHPPSQRVMNVYRGRYTHPGGLTFDKRDPARVLNSSVKEHSGYIDTVIEANPGVWSAPVGSGFS